MVEYRNTGYFVTSEGLVFGKRGKVLVPSNTTGYQSVKVSIHGTITYHRVHRMVAECYLPNPENLPCVNHKDGNKQNNHVDNLEWCSYEENINHAVSTGLLPQGVDTYDATLSETEAHFICRKLEEGLSVQKTFYKCLDAGFIVYPNRISDIKRRKTWKSVSVNYHW